MSSSLLHQLPNTDRLIDMSLFHQRYVEVLGFLKKDIQSAIVWPVPRRTHGRTGLAETGIRRHATTSPRTSPGVLVFTSSWGCS